MGYQAAVLLSHLHWDHVQGLPFFAPVAAGGGSIDVYGPEQGDRPLGEVFTGVMSPPYFPIRPTSSAATSRSRRRRRRLRRQRREGALPVDPPRRPDPRVPRRLEGVSVAYLPDHGPGTVPTIADDFVPDDVLDLCDGVDLLIHDAQHTPRSTSSSGSWGHCTIDYAVHVAKEAGAAQLALFHHCPSHGDDADRRDPARRPRPVGAGIGGPRS